MSEWKLHDLLRQRSEAEQEFSEIEAALEDLALGVTLQCARDLLNMALKMPELPLEADLSGNLSLRSSDLIFSRARKIVWVYEDAIKREKFLRREQALQKEISKRKVKALNAKISKLSV